MTAKRERSDPQHNLAERLDRIIEEVRILLAGGPTAQLVHHFHGIFRHGPREALLEFGLSSPFRQSMYALGLLLTTPEPASQEPLGEPEFSRLHTLIQAATESYAFLLSPGPEELAKFSAEKRVAYATSGPAFLNYYFTGPLLSGEQVLMRAKALFRPFGDELRRMTGIPGLGAIEIAEAIAAMLQTRLDRSVEYLDRATAVEARLLRGELSFADAAATIAGGAPPDALLVDRDTLRRRFGDANIEAFWKLFVVRRGTVSDFRYFTEANPLDFQPLLYVDEDTALSPLANSLFLGLLNTFTSVLTGSEETKERFLKVRDRWLESETVRVLAQIDPPAAAIHASRAETPTGEFEHDLILTWQDRVLVMEAKASPPAVPFRDVERAFTRLRRAFRSDSGIQKAYDQAMRVVGPLSRGENLTLYDPDGIRALDLQGCSIVEALPVCVTASDFGPLATDVSLLLEKPDDAPYPWVVSVHDLEAFLEALSLKGWGMTELFRFVSERTRLHGLLLCADELEICGMFLRHGKLPDISRGSVMQVDPAYSDIFDSIYLWKHGAGPRPNLDTRGEPVVTDVTHTLRQAGEQILRARAWLDWPVGVSADVGRNAPCPCGSGRKFKRCHGSFAPPGH
jgi:SEC-C motif